MATTKRLTPTGVNMSIPEFTDRPDQRVNSTALGQLADAINANSGNAFSDKGNGVSSLISYVKTLGQGTYTFRADTASDAPQSGGVVYTINKTHIVNDTRCVIKATAMDSSAPNEYVAFLGSNATTITWQQIVPKSDIVSIYAGVPVRRVGVIQNNATLTVSFYNDYSTNAEFALVCLNLSGNAAVGYAILALGRGTGKWKDIIGLMDTNYYSCSYSNGTWTITNTSGSAIYYTILATRLAAGT